MIKIVQKEIFVLVKNLKISFFKVLIPIYCIEKATTQFKIRSFRKIRRKINKIRKDRNNYFLPCHFDKKGVFCSPFFHD